MSVTRYVIPALALLGGVYAFYSTSRPAHVPGKRVVAPNASAAPSAIHGAGIVEAPGGEIIVDSPITGVVTAVYVTPGERVDVGDTLLRLEDREAAAAVLARTRDVWVADARAAEAEGARANAYDEFARFEQLHRLGPGLALSERDLATWRFAAEAASGRARTARAEVESARAALTLARRWLERHTVRAPVSGMVLRVNVRAGELVGNPAADEPPLVLMRSGPLHVRAAFDEHDAWRFQAGAAAVAAVPGNQGSHVRLRYLHVEPMIVPKRTLTGARTELVDTRVLEVVFEVIETRLRLYVGQQVDVQVRTDTTSTRSGVR